MQPQRYAALSFCQPGIHYLRDFLPHLRDHSFLEGCYDHSRDCPVLPDEVVSHFMNITGVDSAVPNVLRIIGMATQKFISDVGTAALQLNSEGSSTSIDDPDSNFTLTLPDLYKALSEYDDSINLPKKAEYYA